MNKDAFAGFHPLVNILYFAAVIGFSMFFMHPASLALSLVCAFAYALFLNGRKALRTGLVFMLPLMLVTAALNPLFNHQGATILAHLPNGNPLTLESTLFGISAAAMLVTVIAWFMCFNKIITSDKLVWLLGRFIPALSLILSMALRMVPRFAAQVKIVSNAQKCIGRDVSRGNIFRRARVGIKILSIMATWALENAIETADSMKSRGYGLRGRSSFSIYRFDRRDALALAYITACSALIITGAVLEVFRFRYFPTIAHIAEVSPIWNVMLFAVHFALCAFPLIINIKEVIIWKRITSKI